MSSNKLFKKERKHKKWQPYIKYFIIASIAVFLLVGLVSLALFLRSIDYDLDNIVDVSTTALEESTGETETENTVSVESLEGTNQIAFIILNNSKEFEFCSIISTDYDNHKMTVHTVDDKSLADEYNKGNKNLLSSLNSTYGYNLEKYAVFTYSSLRAFLSEYKSYNINVLDNVNYHSEDFILELEKGMQELNGENLYKYIRISDNYTRSLVISDIINNYLTAENIEIFDDIFKDFINNSDSNISVVDFDYEADRLKVYAVAYDKFYPEAVN